VEKNVEKSVQKEPDTLDVIKKFLKNNGVTVIRKSRESLPDYLKAYIGYTSLYIEYNTKIVFRINDIDGPKHTIETDIADPSNKALDALLKICHFFTIAFFQFEAELDITDDVVEELKKTKG
jgi:hypothetical protein